jgi:hypothetical protein
MSELRRLWDETDSDVERALLHAGRSYRCSPLTVTKTMAALGLAGSASVVAMGAAGAAVPSPLAKALAAKLGVKVLIALSAVGVAGAVPVAYRALHHGDDAISIREQGHSRGEPSSRHSWAAAPVPAEAPAADVLDPPAEPEVALAPRAAASTPRSTRQASTLGAEISSLDAARSMLARGNAREALFLLEGYGRGFPHGKLALEAELLRIDALAKSGDEPQARRRARLFLTRHPSSVLAARARTYLDD